ncbi:MAG: 5'-Nucleotidase domain protein [Ignavibacteriae bacterium]|nr:MAG: 5'-Nucleotidase domain protein [Ignavibacteriota bacterium]
MKKIFIMITFLLICYSINVIPNDVKYRTFTQSSLSDKPNKLKEYASKWCYQLTNKNSSLQTVNGLRLVFSAKVKSISDPGPFTNISGLGTKTVDLTGAIIDSGQVVNICGIGEKKQMTMVKYVWLKDGEKIGKAMNPPPPTLYQQLLPMPNFGWARWLIYANAYTARGGLLIGVERLDSPMTYGWLHYMNGAVTREAFPHTGIPRGFDTWGKNGHTQQPFIGPKKNFKVWKHDNHLLGEVHALKLAVTANDIGLTEPDTPHTALGDLIFNDLTTPTNPFNGRTIREILLHADSALTMWTWYPAGYHIWLDSIISMINSAFTGEMDTVSTLPLKIKVAVALSDIPFLHPNTLIKRNILNRTNIVALPETPMLYQNYPNPFNPNTTIEFYLPQDAIVSLKIYDLLGKEVANLLKNKQLEADHHTIDFDASELPSGVYFYKLDVMGESHYYEVKKMILLK